MTTRYFNTITIIDDKTLRKSSKDAKKILAEYRWFENEKVFKHPKVSNLNTTGDVASYDIEYIHGRTLADLYVNELLPLDVFVKIFKHISDKLYYVHKIGVDESDPSNYRMYKVIEKMYANKTLSRLSEYGMNLKTEYTINGEKLPSLKRIIESCEEYATTSDLAYIHGDLCFSNIILSDEYDRDTSNIEDHLYFIDPRGLLSDGTITSIGDYKYDVGKLAHSTLGKYDMIMSGKVKAEKLSDTEFVLNIPESDYKLCVDDLFLKIFGNDERWYNIMVQLFLSMIPLHADNKDHQDTMLANALRIYSLKKKLFS